MITIKIKQTGNFLQALTNVGNLRQAILNPEEANKKTRLIAELVKNKIVQNIEQGRDYRGGKLAKLKRSTILRKGFSRVLIETGKLLQSIAVRKSAGGYAVYIRKIGYGDGSNTAEVATYLQEGTERMIARPFFGLTQKDFSAIVKSVMRNTKIKFRKAA